MAKMTQKKKKEFRLQELLQENLGNSSADIFKR
jgi:hypothetical protein